MWTSHRVLLTAVGLGMLGLGCENPAVEGLDAPAQVSRAGAGAEERSDDRGPEERPGVAGAAAVAPSAPRLRGTPCAEGSGACDGSLAGTYAVEMDLDVYWYDALNQAAPAFDPGRGSVRVLWLSKLSDMCPGGGPGESVARVCGVELPAVYASDSGAALQLVMKDELWDRPSMPAFVASAQPSAGDVMIDRVTTTFGLELEDLEAPWPSADETPFVACSSGRTGADCFVDQDGDGAPGISLQVRSGAEAADPGYEREGGWHYVPAPNHPSAAYVASGATELYAGLRVALGGSHPVGVACRGGSGPARASEIALRVFDCALDDGTRCSGASAAYVDRNLPAFRVLEAGEVPPSEWRHEEREVDRKLDRGASEGGWNTVVRLGGLEEDRGCEAVREAFRR